MVVDTSVILALLLNEAEAERFAHALVEAPTRFISTATVLEASIVIQSRFGDAGSYDFDRLLTAFQPTIIPVTEKHVAIAREAYRRYGKGQGHAAALNYGDLFSYALAKDLGEPLLFKGDDFSHTDVRPVTY